MSSQAYLHGCSVSTGRRMSMVDKKTAPQLSLDQRTLFNTTFHDTTLPDPSIKKVKLRRLQPMRQKMVFVRQFLRQSETYRSNEQLDARPTHLALDKRDTAMTAYDRAQVPVSAMTPQTDVRRIASAIDKWCRMINDDIAWHKKMGRRFTTDMLRKEYPDFCQQACTHLLGTQTQGGSLNIALTEALEKRGYFISYLKNQQQLVLVLEGQRIQIPVGSYIAVVPAHLK